MIFGNVVDLRPIHASDLALLRNWEHDPHIDHLMATKASALDARESHEQEFERLLRTPRVKIMAVQTKTAAVVGFIRLNDLDMMARKGVVRLFIAPEMQGQGYGSDALRTLLHFCFYELGLHRIGLVVREDNIRAIAIYKHIGFISEGCERQALWSNGKWVDFLHMGLLAHEWQQELA